MFSKWNFDASKLISPTIGEKIPKNIWLVFYKIGRILTMKTLKGGYYTQMCLYHTSIHRKWLVEYTLVLNFATVFGKLWEIKKKINEIYFEIDYILKTLLRWVLCL